MSCELSQTVHAYFDNELDPVRSSEFEQHLQSCPECLAALQAAQTLRRHIQAGDLYVRASSLSREKIQRGIASLELQETPQKPLKLRLPWNWLAPSFSAALAVLLWTVLFSAKPAPANLMASELVDAHVRSLQPGHLTDVISSDQHTVKPWFDGKLDFVPPVADFAAQGFPLVGGRLDVLDGHVVAVLVYSRRKHFVNVFVWPSREPALHLQGSGSQSGYHWLSGTVRDMNFCLVSDAQITDLQELESLIRQ